jgi:hypothetical protein
MIAEYDLLKTLHQAFLTALLLTGSAERAEAAVIGGISASDLDYQCEEELLFETVKSAIQLNSEIPRQFKRALSILPLELRSVLLLPLLSRQCFVMRVLVGLNLEACAKILHLDIHKVEESTLTAMETLPFVESRDLESGMSPACT